MTESSTPRARPRLKVCCIASVEEAQLAINHGADAIGLVSSMPSGPGVIPDHRIGEIAARIPPGVSTFLLTSSTNVDHIVDQQKRCGVNTIQLCDELPPRHIRDLRQALPGIAVVQVVHVMDETAVSAAQAAATAAHALLLDSGNTAKPIKELGGTGRTHDWSVSRRIREAVEIPIFLAGGLTPDNVAEAVRQVRPFGIDVCSGLRTDNRLDARKLRLFVQALTSPIP